MYVNLKLSTIILFSTTVACELPDRSMGDSSEGSNLSQESGVECREGDFSLIWDMVPPDNIQVDDETNEIEVTVDCTIDSINGTAANGWTATLMCNGDNSPTERDQSYTLQFNLSDVPEGISASAEVTLTYRLWQALDVGAGERVLITTGGEPIFGLYRETADGAIQLCASSDGIFTSLVNQWLQSFSAQLEYTNCDNGSTLRLSRQEDDMTFYAYPGELVTLGDITGLIDTANCSVRPNGGSEAWDLSLALWRP